MITALPRLVPTPNTGIFCLCLDPSHASSESSFMDEAALRHAFRVIEAKYDLKSKRDTIAAFLTDGWTQREDVEKEFADRFGMTAEDAATFIAFMRLVSHKAAEQHMQRKAAEAEHRRACMAALPPGGSFTLLRALLAPHDPVLGLPDTSTFCELSTAVNAQSIVSSAAAKVYANHSVYYLPRQLSEGVKTRDRCHCFTLHPFLSQPLNAGLGVWARHKAASAQVAAQTAGSGRDVGLDVSNVGGYHSNHDLFDCSSADAIGEWTSEGAERQGRGHCRMLHAVASVAVDELLAAGVVTLDGGTSGEMHPAKAWVNVSRSGDYNVLHTHSAEKLSAVYYVDSGWGTSTASTADRHEPGSEDSQHNTTHGVTDPSEHSVDGCLVFRAGPPPTRTGEAAVAGATHSYMAVHPLPGTLWLFPGHIPHAVMAMSGIGNQAPDRRISVAMNFTNATVRAHSENDEKV